MGGGVKAPQEHDITARAVGEWEGPQEGWVSEAPMRQKPKRNQKKNNKILEGYKSYFMF